jgi:hypothetical protein
MLRCTTVCLQRILHEMLTDTGPRRSGIGCSNFPIAKVTVTFKAGTWPWQAICQTGIYLSASK